MQDDEHDAEKAVNAYNALKDWGMQVSLCTVTSAPGAAAAPLYQEDSTFAITPSGSSLAVIYADSTNLTGAYGNVFQMCFTDPNQGVASADYLSTHTDLGTKVAVIYKNDDNYSTGIYEKFMSEAEAKGLEVVYTGTFAGEDNDFNVQLTQAQAAGADVLFLPIYYQPASTILKQANDMGYAPSVFGVDGMDGILSMEGFDTSLAEGVVVLTPYSADDTSSLNQSFVKKYQDKFGEIPNQFAADGYDCIYAMYKAATEAGIDPASMDHSAICDAMVAKFTSMTFDGLTGASMTWGKDGTVSKLPNAVVIENGAYVGM
jgi:branched-chain amino acid transport system substrate-binding protein